MRLHWRRPARHDPARHDPAKHDPSTVMTEVELALLCGRNLEDVESEVLTPSQLEARARRAADRHAHQPAPGQPHR